MLLHPSHTGGAALYSYGQVLAEDRHHQHALLERRLGHGFRRGVHYYKGANVVHSNNQITVESTMGHLVDAVDDGAFEGGLMTMPSLWCHGLTGLHVLFETADC